jgi:CRISPR-associated endonuclease/helicase Cas3
MAFYAHSGTPADRADWQPLAEHLENVARLAAEMAAPLGLDKAARIAGQLHDLGKYTAAFQCRLAGADVSVDHSTAGAVKLAELASGHDKGIAELIAYAILGHHAGLPDRFNESASCFNRRVEKPLAELDPAWQEELQVDASGLLPAFAAGLSKDPDEAAFQYSVMARMIFSCLVDADFQDTEAYYTRLEGRQVDRQWQGLQKLLPSFIAKFDAHMSAMTPADSSLNSLRAEILAHVRSKAGEGPGLFTMTVPTGGGKTLASLGFALDHAQLHGHSRIIYAIPFTSIIDQTATIFRGILGDGHVLEHHSGIDEETFDRDRPREARDKLKLAMEDWAAPVIVTTNVQFFESLFAARTSRARKLHNIAGSVIILDEAQTIPRHLLRPCMRMLDELALNYGCTIVLCTATQPALDQRNLGGGLPLEGRELAPDPHRLASNLRRTRIVHAGPMNNEALIAALAEEPQCLVIVNSRKHALEVFREAEAAGMFGLVHLTTRQHAADRRVILADARRRLGDGASCRLIATSLVEAGVDIDFPRVWRAEAGLDQIIQAAGRCNREGKRHVEDSVVTVFEAPDYRPPAEIEGLVGDMKRVIGQHDDLSSLAAIEEYFGEVYWRMGDRLDGKEKATAILPRFRFGRFGGQMGTDFAFRSVAADFRMIDSGMVPVVIANDAKSSKVVKDLGIEKISSGSLARRLQNYIVQVPPNARETLVRNGHVGFVRPDLRGDQFAVLITESLYRQDVGLLWENADYLAMENTIIS